MLSFAALEDAIVLSQKITCPICAKTEASYLDRINSRLQVMIMIGLHNFSCSNLVGSCHGIGLKLRFGNSTHMCCFCSGRNRECSERERVDALLLFLLAQQVSSASSDGFKMLYSNYYINC